MSTIKRIAKNTMALTGSEVLNKALSLFLYIAIANYLKDSGYGKFSFIMTILGFFQVIANFGLDKLTIREVAKSKDKTHEYVASMLRFKVFLALAAYLSLAIFINLTGKGPDVIYGVYLVGFSIFFINLSNTYMAIFNAHEKLEINAILLVFVKFIIVGLAFLGIYLKVGLLYILSFFVIGEAIRTIIFYFLYKKHFKISKILKENLLSKRTLIMAAPFAATGVASLIYNHIDIVMLSLMIGDKAVGWYSAAYTLILGLMFIPRSYTLSVFPVISRYAIGSNGLLNIAWQKSVKFLLIISLPITLGVILLAGRFIHFFYHSGYENSINALEILILATPWIFVNSINIYLLYAANKQKQAIIIILISMVLNIVLNCILIPKFSYIGASWATVLVEIVNVFMCFGFIYAAIKFKVKILNILPKPLLATLIMGNFIYYFQSLNLGLLISISGIMYIGMLLLLKVFDEQDKDILSKAFPFITMR